MKSLIRTQYGLVVATVLLMVLALMLVAAVLLQEIPAQVMVWLSLLLPLVLGLIGPKLIDWIKDVLGLTGLAAFRLVLLIAAVVAAASMLLAGYFAGFDASPEAILAAFGVFLATVTYVYKGLNPRAQTP